MTVAETKRYAHGLIAEIVETFVADRQGRHRSEEWVRIFAAVNAIGEQHRRFGPKSTDKAPRAMAPYRTPLLDKLEDTTMDKSDGGGL